MNADLFGGFDDVFQVRMEIRPGETGSGIRIFEFQGPEQILQKVLPEERTAVAIISSQRRIRRRTKPTKRWVSQTHNRASLRSWICRLLFRDSMILMFSRIRPNCVSYSRIQVA